MKRLIFLFLALPMFSSAQVFRVGSFADTPPGPFIQLSPNSLTLASNSQGTQGASSVYTFTWFQWTISADTVTAPTGFLVSVDNVTFVSSLIFSTPGTTGSVNLYVALAAGNTPGTYTGNVTHASGPATASLPVAGTTNGVPSLGVSPSSLTLTDTVGSPGAPQPLTATFSFLTGSVNVTIPAAPTPLEMSQDGGTTWASSLSFNSGSPKSILVRVTSAASTGPIVDTIQFASAGVATIKIPVGGTVTNPAGAHYRAITIPSTAVTSSLIGFPMVFNETQTWLKTVANGGEVQNANGYDITFSRDAAGTSLLNWEVETYNPATGQLVAWIKTDSLSSFGTTTVYIRYNQSSISTFQGGSAGAVWDANYVGVWHMNQVLTAAGQTENDYTSNAHNYTASGTWTSAQSIAGPVGLGIKSLNANSNSFQWTTSGLGGLTGDFTAEGWFKITVASNASTTFGSTSFANDLNWFSGNYRLYNGSDAIVDGNSTSTNVWTHLVVTRSGNNFVLYHNGVSTATATQGSGFTYNFQNLFISLTTVSADIFGDELRLSTIARPAALIAAQYSNQNAPDSFYSIGTEH